MKDAIVATTATVLFFAFLGYGVFAIGQCDARQAQQMEACKVACGERGVHSFTQRGCECK